MSDNWKFGTYWGDANTGLDYANNRCYSNSLARFFTPDPYASNSVNPENPQSWNRYSHASNDPANRVDPKGSGDCDTACAVLEGCTGDPNDYCSSDPTDFECAGQYATNSVCDTYPTGEALYDPSIYAPCFGMVPV